MTTGEELLLTHTEERTDEYIDGTIIDFETVGEFLRGIGLEVYRDHQPVSLGFLSGHTLTVVARKGDKAVHEVALRKVCREMIFGAKRPFYAFNAEFEIGVLFWFIEEVVPFDRDIQFLIKAESGAMIPEAKRYVVKNLGIPNFDDPFNDVGKLVQDSWKKYLETGDESHLMDIIHHNRACLLKEYWILEKRGKWRPVSTYQAPKTSE